jgi:hypothetical protein
VETVRGSAPERARRLAQATGPELEQARVPELVMVLATVVVVAVWPCFLQYRVRRLSSAAELNLEFARCGPGRVHQ